MKAEPRGFADYREYEPAYKQSLSTAGFETASLNFGFFHVLTELPDHEDIPVADIAWPGLCAIEVKTRSDMAGSVASGRMEWAIWNMKILEFAGVTQGSGVIIRNCHKPLHPDAVPSWEIAQSAMAKWPKRYGVTLLPPADGPADVARIAKSFMREYHEPKDAAMPPPIIPAWAMEWPFAVRVYAMIEGLLDDTTGKRGPGIGAELAKKIAASVSFKGITEDAHNMDVDAFCDAWKHRHGFGGRENVRLRALHRSLNDDSLYKEPEYGGVFIMKRPEDVINQ
jgi:hypothetical protein